jgi:hypothetical protein
MGMDEDRYKNSLQMQCNIIGIKKADITMQFMKEWLDCCLDYKIMFGEEKYPNYEGFIVHRHDQLLFSLLREKYNFPYVNRTENIWIEYIIPEINYIEAENPMDNSYRKEEDRKDNK